MRPLFFWVRLRGIFFSRGRHRRADEKESIDASQSTERALPQTSKRRCPAEKKNKKDSGRGGKKEMEAEASDADGDKRRQQQEQRDDRLDAALRASGVTLVPHPHQRTAVRWWLTREGARPEDRATPSGGILADEMGLGKSMSAVMSVLLSRSILAGRTAPKVHASPLPVRPGTWATTSAPVAAPGRASAGGPVVLAPTLIVCPKTLLIQWQREIFRHTTLAPDDIHVFYGRAGRRAARRQVADKVFVLTTYETVLGSFESLRAPRSQHGHLVSLVGHSAQGDHSKKNSESRDMTNCTTPLLPCQPADDEDGDTNRPDPPARPSPGAGDDSNHNNNNKTKPAHGSSVLHGIVWDRIVLDEAHTIRNWQTSKTHRAVCALRADRRWCLTGTAFNNSASDVVALCRFIGVAPYADPRWWADPDDDQIDTWRQTFLLRRTKAALLAGDPGAAGVRLDSNASAYTGDGAGHTIVGACATSSVPMATAAAAALGPASLPPKVEKVRRVPLSEREAAFYDRLAVGAVADFGAFTHSKGADKSRMFGQMLEWLTRLRQACCDPLVLKGRAATIVYSPTSLADRGRHESHCVRCHAAAAAAADLPSAPPSRKTTAAALARLACGHVSCADCAQETGAKCVLCSGERSPSAVDNGRASSVVVTTEPACGPSSRTASMVRFMNKIFAKDPRAKMVVFSQWSTYLDLVESAIVTRVGVDYVRIDGGVRQIERRNALVDRFTSDPGARCLLMTIGVGSVGLNLVCANYVLLMDAHYNPFAEAQAIDRVHRIGQTRPVRVVRFRSDASVDAAVAQIQAVKRAGAAVFLEGATPQVPSVGVAAATTPGGAKRKASARGIDEHQLRSILGDMIAARRDSGDQPINSFFATASSRASGMQCNVDSDIDDVDDSDDEYTHYDDDDDDDDGGGGRGNDDDDDDDNANDDMESGSDHRHAHAMDSDGVCDSHVCDDRDNDKDHAADEGADKSSDDDDGDDDDSDDSDGEKDTKGQEDNTGIECGGQVRIDDDDWDGVIDERAICFDGHARPLLRRLKRTADTVGRRRDARPAKRRRSRRRRYGPLA
ncbi:SNF2 family DNA dependent ATPase [Pandoravirus salinus]|uniref:SNF2 family DNA dependent ATPase n=1 Tax=Pandoravirus salinus TaxID=1349410 RepID=S4W0U8_9VIRU|nr:SNF2 family DNA dependent ATPase [Pandoravirus salinus]AGO83745.1 SNF2 family DNA dependent ATPase [Pandoravirus salinus]